MSEKEKKKITTVFKTSRGLLHFYGKKKRIAVKLHSKSNHSEATRTQGLPDPVMRANLGSGDPSEPGTSQLEVRKHLHLSLTGRKLRLICFTFLSSMVVALYFRRKPNKSKSKHEGARWDTLITEFLESR